MFKYGHNEVNEDNNKVIVALLAPTGLAAFNINGLTLHRFFKLPVQKSNNNCNNIKYSNDEIKILRDLMKNVKLFLIGIL